MWASADTVRLIKAKSSQEPQVILKHSSRFISSMNRNRLEKARAPGELSFHFLDLIAYCLLSDKVATEFLAENESPQILVLKNRECVYDESHIGISMDDIIEKAKI